MSDELERAFPDLFILLNSTCSVEFQDLGDSFYWSKVLESPFDSVTETYSRSAVFDYDYRENFVSYENGYDLPSGFPCSELDLKSLQILILIRVLP